ncbi:MAG: hypothetical protein HYS87_02715 [Candidatus Colwellbacteria bacterium]|nr:hypothetical protein [Candidatus Colwellbacteria bacterium]
MEFLFELWNDIKNLFDPIVVVVKGLFAILAKIFSFFASFITNLLSGGGA